MAHLQNQYDANPVRQPVQTDEYGNPIGTAGTGTYGTTGGAYETTGQHKHKEHGGLGGMLHRSGSGSSSSSSSEDDGFGGRRKKGVKEKIKEKMPGGHKEGQAHSTSTTTPGGYGSAAGQHHEKGVMDKIKEKLPGGHH